MSLPLDPTVLAVILARRTERKRRRLDLIPPVARVADTTGFTGPWGCYTPETRILYQIRRLLLDGADRPVKVVGTCGYGTWRDQP